MGWFPLAPGEVFVPGYRVSRAYVNNVNITNTSVSVTRVTNVYNRVIVNRNATVNNVTYVNQRVHNGVTVVSHDAFVNARPVAQNVMRVDERELARAPVTRAVREEPVRSSVLGAGRSAPVKPPSNVISRPVVAVRTPSAPPRPIEQRQAQAGGRLNQQSLVRPAGPTQPATMNQNRRAQPNQDGFRPFTQPNGNNSQVRQMPGTQPRTYEQQGTPQTENRNAQRQENRNAQAAYRPAPQETHPLVRPAPPVQQRNQQQEQQQEQKFNQWHQQRPAPPPQREASRPAPRQERPAPRQERPAPRQERPKGH